MDCLLILWLTLPLVPLVTVAIHLVFWTVIPKKSFLYFSLYILIEKSLKHLCFIKLRSPGLFCLSLSLSLSLFLADSLERGDYRAHFSARASKTPSRAPGAFVSDASPVSRTLLVLCINQGISASFSLLLSYRRLCTTKFWSIKGPQKLEIRLFLWLGHSG